MENSFVTSIVYKLIFHSSAFHELMKLPESNHKIVLLLLFASVLVILM